MAVWNGWQIELLKAANLPADETHGNFLFDWHSHASSNCGNNPIDISRGMPGATNCKRLTPNRTAKNYTSRAQAALAFSREIHSGNYPNLLAALGFADPYQSPKPAAVVADIEKWGSRSFASYYATHSSTGDGSGGGSGAGSVELPKGHRGYHDFQKSLAHYLPTKARRSKIIRQRVLRKLGAPRKVIG